MSKKVKVKAKAVIHADETLIYKEASHVKLDVLKYRDREDSEKMVEMLINSPADIMPTRIVTKDLGKIRTSKPMESYYVMATLITLFGVPTDGKKEIVTGKITINGEPFTFNKRSDKVFERITK